MKDPKEIRKTSILAAAGRVFSARGFEDSSIADIAQAAGVATGTIYNYFRDKTELVETMVAQLIASLGKEESLPLHLDQGDRLEQRIFERMKKLHDHYTGISALLPFILGTPKFRIQFRDAFLEPVLKALETELGGTDAAIPARILMAGALGFQLMLLLGEPKTIEAWSAPVELSKHWAKFIRQAITP